jgi:uncharacterized membrane protein YkvI
MGFPECQQPSLDCAGGGRGPVYRLVDENMTVATWIGSLVLLEVVLILWMKKHLQKIEQLPWW